MAKKVLSYVLVFVLGAAVCGFAVYRLTKADYSKQTDKLSADIAKLEDTARKRDAVIESLTADNKSANARADRLEVELRERDKRFADRLAEIGSQLERAATALEGSDGGIDDVIEGLGQVKELVEALP